MNERYRKWAEEKMLRVSSRHGCKYGCGSHDLELVGVDLGIRVTELYGPGGQRQIVYATVLCRGCGLLASFVRSCPLEVT